MPGEITGLELNFKHSEFYARNRGTIAYKNSEGKRVEFTPKDPHAKDFFEIVDKYATKDSPQITPEEVVELRGDIAKKILPTVGGQLVRIDYYKGIDFILDTYQSNKSDGGENITPKEIGHIFETFQAWM